MQNVQKFSEVAELSNG